LVIDVDDAIRLLEAEVEKAGVAYVYEPPKRDGDWDAICRYEFDGQPSCLVGRCYVAAGATAEDLENLDLRNFGSGISADEVRSLGSLTITEDAAEVFRRAQEYQDDRIPYGVALAEAKVLAENLKADREAGL
jgi:hypothetical protein